ncbi:uncharacterized protein LOC107044943 [Diachasma alloeum]|uniref:uncharacterized protein LOC107044943 n=1 Tax=Diachasma alloeum TaxID=454923 RepID=UPI0007381E8C|nr:uncharacterized protein LOC107044943 [Diachasma alloeum]
MRNFKSKTERQNWDPLQMAKAIEAVEIHKSPLLTAANDYNVSRNTLRRRIELYRQCPDMDMVLIKGDEPGNSPPSNDPNEERGEDEADLNSSTSIPQHKEDSSPTNSESGHSVEDGIRTDETLMPGPSHANVEELPPTRPMRKVHLEHHVINQGGASSESESEDGDTGSQQTPLNSEFKGKLIKKKVGQNRPFQVTPSALEPVPVARDQSTRKRRTRGKNAVLTGEEYLSALEAKKKGANEIEENKKKCQSKKNQKSKGKSARTKSSLPQKKQKKVLEVEDERRPIAKASAPSQPIGGSSVRNATIGVLLHVLTFHQMTRTPTSSATNVNYSRSNNPISI